MLNEKHRSAMVEDKYLNYRQQIDLKCVKTTHCSSVQGVNMSLALSNQSYITNMDFVQLE